MQESISKQLVSPYLYVCMLNVLCSLIYIHDTLYMLSTV